MWIYIIFSVIVIFWIIEGFMSNKELEKIEGLEKRMNALDASQKKMFVDLGIKE